jgi:uncharacterized protein (TIGR02145 family)
MNMKLNVLGIVLCLLALMGCSEVSKGVNIESEDNAPEYELNKLVGVASFISSEDYNSIDRGGTKYEVTLYELDSSASWTGREFTTYVTYPNVFKFENLKLQSSNIVMCVRNKMSRSGYWSFADLSRVDSVYVNFMTNMEYNRILYLMKKGIPSDSAERTAQHEIMEYMLSTSLDIKLSNQIEGNEKDAELQAVWQMLSRIPYTRLSSQLSSDTAVFWMLETDSAKIDTFKTKYADMIEGNLWVKSIPKTDYLVTKLSGYVFGQTNGLGECSDKNDGEVKKVTNPLSRYFERPYMCSKDTGWICPNGTFQELYGIEKGHDGEVIKANFTSFSYAYDSLQGKWVSAHVEQGFACVSSRFGMVLVSEAMGKPSYLVCKADDNDPDYLHWAAISDSAYIAYNTQGLECDSLGRIQKGLKDTTSKFVCSNGQFKIPSSLDLNMGFTCNLVNEGYFKYQNSNYHCDGVKWEYATDSLVIDSIVDERNNVLYKTVGIGSQVWMKENLNYIVDSSYCFRDDKELCKIYGRLYQWNANIGSKDEKDNICPKGFHVPSSKDWETLKSFVRSTFDRVDYTRILGTKDGWEKRTEWYIGNEDLVGFSALPSGMRGNRGLYDEEYDAAYFCTTDYTDTSYTAYKLQKLGREYLFGVESAKNSVCALRCLKD